jgi:hypothetical protein
VLYLEKSITLFKPFEAYVAEVSNETKLDSYMRQKALGAAEFSKPAIIRWFHYIDKQLVEAIGGVEFCLKAPAWRVERFCDGVLFQLCEELFDPNNLDHLQVQKQVMEYLEI